MKQSPKYKEFEKEFPKVAKLVHQLGPKIGDLFFEDCIDWVELYFRNLNHSATPKEKVALLNCFLGLITKLIIEEKLIIKAKNEGG